METAEQKVYRELAQMDKGESGEPKPIQNRSAFILHVVLKAIPLALIILRNFLWALIGKTLVIQLILISVVLDFWFTKNITGRLMTGLRWAFEEDEYGIERLRFEGRVNEEYVNSLSSKLFWIVLGIYCILPILFIVASFLITSGVHHASIQSILLNAVVLVGGATNFYFFWRAKSGVSDRRSELKTKLGGDFTKQLGLASVISYF